MYEQSVKNIKFCSIFVFKKETYLDNVTVFDCFCWNKETLRIVCDKWAMSSWAKYWAKLGRSAILLKTGDYLTCLLKMWC